MTNHARNGAARERRVRDHMIRHGWTFIMRSAGSRGPADIAMAHEEYGLALVQVGTAAKALGPEDRARLLHASWLTSALPVVATVDRSITYRLVTDGPASRWAEWRP